MSEGADAMAAFLAASDAGCPSCGYGLRGVTLARCPECGMPLALDLLRDGPMVSRDSPAPASIAEPDISWTLAAILAGGLLIGMIAALAAIIEWLS